MFPLIQRITPEQNAQNTSIEAQQIYILPHDASYNTPQLDSYTNTESLLQFPVSTDSQNSFYNLLDDQASVGNIAVASQSEVVPSFEITNELKNYATVNTLENIPNQISYNLGTESVDADETINNTESGTLENSSIITEIENSGINMFDMVLNNKNMLELKVPQFDVNLLTNATPQSNLFQNKPADLVDLNKQIRATEAIEMSLVCEEEVPSQWIDVMSLASSQNPSNNFEPLLINENPLSAIPTAIQSYINIETPLTNVPQDENTSELYTDFQYTIEEHQNILNKQKMDSEIDGVINETIKKISKESNTSELQPEILYILADNPETERNHNKNTDLLKNLTADVNICKCIDCKCGSENDCNSKTSGESCCSSNSTQTTHNYLKPAVEDTNTSTKKSSCNKFNLSSNCECAPPQQNQNNNSQCCVMVCLKSLDQLRHVLSLANKCCSLQSITMGLANQNEASFCGEK